MTVLQTLASAPTAYPLSGGLELRRHALAKGMKAGELDAIASQELKFHGNPYYLAFKSQVAGVAGGAVFLGVSFFALALVSGQVGPGWGCFQATGAVRLKPYPRGPRIMEKSVAPLPEDLFQVAWENAQRAGLTRQVFAVVPDPYIKQVDKQAGWLLARALGEADALQRAIGNWFQESPPSDKTLKDTLGALRKGPRGPAWWRRLTAPWRHIVVNQWHSDLSDEVRRVSFMKGEIAHVQKAVEATRNALDAWDRWARDVLPSEALEGWSLRHRVLGASMEMLSHRLALRRKVSADYLRTLSHALSLVDIVRQAKGVQADGAWEKAARLAKAGLPQQRS